MDWSLEVAEFDAEAREGSYCVDDESTAVAGMMVALAGIRSLLNGTVDTDRVSSMCYGGRWRS